MNIPPNNIPGNPFMANAYRQRFNMWQQHQYQQYAAQMAFAQNPYRYGMNFNGMMPRNATMRPNVFMANGNRTQNLMANSNGCGNANVSFGNMSFNQQLSQSDRFTQDNLNRSRVLIQEIESTNSDPNEADPSTQQSEQQDPRKDSPFENQPLSKDSSGSSGKELPISHPQYKAGFDPSTIKSEPTGEQHSSLDSSNESAASSEPLPSGQVIEEEKEAECFLKRPVVKLEDITLSQRIVDKNSEPTSIFNAPVLSTQPSEQESPVDQATQSFTSSKIFQAPCTESERNRSTTTRFPPEDVQGEVHESDEDEIFKPSANMKPVKFLNALSNLTSKSFPMDCRKCSKSVKTKNMAEKHIEDHCQTVKRPLQCKICGDQFYKNQIGQHFKKVHQMTKQYDSFLIDTRWEADDELLETLEECFLGKKVESVPPPTNTDSLRTSGIFMNIGELFGSSKPRKTQPPQPSQGDAHGELGAETNPSVTSVETPSSVFLPASKQSNAESHFPPSQDEIFKRQTISHEPAPFATQSRVKTSFESQRAQTAQEVLSAEKNPNQSQRGPKRKKLTITAEESEHDPQDDQSDENQSDEDYEPAPKSRNRRGARKSVVKKSASVRKAQKRAESKSPTPVAKIAPQKPEETPATPQEKISGPSKAQGSATDGANELKEPKEEIITPAEHHKPTPVKPTDPIIARGLETCELEKLAEESVLACSSNIYSVLTQKYKEEPVYESEEGAKGTPSTEKPGDRVTDPPSEPKTVGSNNSVNFDSFAEGLKKELVTNPEPSFFERSSVPAEKISNNRASDRIQPTIRVTPAAAQHIKDVASSTKKVLPLQENPIVLANRTADPNQLFHIKAKNLAKAFPSRVGTIKNTSLERLLTANPQVNSQKTSEPMKNLGEGATGRPRTTSSNVTEIPMSASAQAKVSADSLLHRNVGTDFPKPDASAQNRNSIQPETELISQSLHARTPPDDLGRTILPKKTPGQGKNPRRSRGNQDPIAMGLSALEAIECRKNNSNPSNFPNQSENAQADRILANSIGSTKNQRPVIEKFLRDSSRITPPNGTVPNIIRKKAAPGYSEQQKAALSQRPIAPKIPNSRTMRPTSISDPFSDHQVSPGPRTTEGPGAKTADNVSAMDETVNAGALSTEAKEAQWMKTIDRAIDILAKREIVFGGNLDELEKIQKLRGLMKELKQFVDLPIDEKFTAINFILARHNQLTHAYVAYNAVELLQEARIPRELKLINWKGLIKKQLKATPGEPVKIKRLIKQLRREAASCEFVNEVSPTAIKDFLAAEIASCAQKWLLPDGKHLRWLPKQNKA